MAAFDRILSGILEFDTAIDNIRLGDNVVWRVSELSEFRLFMEPYLRQAIADGRNIIYFRFASHEPLVENCPEVKTIEVPLSHRFETFTVDIHNEIEKAGRDAFYIFDCLSELQAMWATDLMMGNFFRVTCPFLFVLDTVAFFPIIRGKHSVHAINKILDTTQLFFDVYYGAYYMPCAAGVGYSYSPYSFLKSSDQSAGMLRLVMGLGTSAVDRTEGSYPRLVSLDMPEKTVHSTYADRHRYSQGKVEVINTSVHDLEHLPLCAIEPEMPAYLQNVLIEHDFDAEIRLREMGRRVSSTFISCKGLVSNKTLMSQMQRMLRCIQDEYEYFIILYIILQLPEV